MKLSIVTPSNRAGLAAYARLFDVCSLASDDVEVIVRDNSGSEEKARVLAVAQGGNCKILTVPPCSGEENWVAVVEAASGDFLLLVGDDDATDRRAVADILTLIETHGQDSSVAGITGQFLVESDAGLRSVAYPPLNAPRAPDRIENFLPADSNAFLYSIVRTSIIRNTFKIIYSFPFSFSYHDQITSLLNLLSGKFESIRRIIYRYDNHEWDGKIKSLQKDLKYYTSAGLDPAIINLHWLLCGFEGAKITAHPNLIAPLSKEDKEAVSRTWFAFNHRRFSASNPTQTGSPFDQESLALREKWKNMRDISFDALLTDICAFMSLFAPAQAYKYYTYWSSF